MRLFSKLALSFSIFAVVPLVLSLLWGIVETKQMLTRMAIEAIEREAHDKSQKLAIYLEKTVEAYILVQNRSSIAEALNGIGSQGDENSKDRLVSELHQAAGIFEGLGIYDTSGRLVAGSSDDWDKNMTIRQDGSGVEASYRREASGDIRIYFWGRLQSAPQEEYLLAARLPIDGIRSLLREVAYEAAIIRSRILAQDNRGEWGWLTLTGNTITGLAVAETEAIPTVDSHVDVTGHGSESKPVVKSIDGREVFYVAHTMVPYNWQLEVEVDKESALLPVRRMVTGGLVSVAGISVLLVVISVMMAKSITRPVVQFRDAAVKLSEGSFEGVTLPDKTSDEVGDLARAFGSMSRKLQKVYQGLEQKVQEKTQELNEKVHLLEQQSTEQQQAKLAMLNVLEDQKEVEAKLKQRVVFDETITKISTEMVSMTADSIDRGINSALSQLGEAVVTDRAYLFLLDNQTKTISNTHEWVREGISSQVHRLQQLTKDTYPWIFGRLWRGEVVAVPVVTDLPEKAAKEEQEFTLENIRSLVTVPITYQGAFAGFLGLDVVSKERQWPGEVEILLKVVGEALINAWHRAQSERELLAEKESVEAKVEERTRELTEKTRALEEAQHKVSEGWLKLQEEKARLQASMQALPLGLLIITTNHEVVVVNGAFSAIVGQPQEGLTYDWVVEQFGQADFDFTQVCPHCREDREAFKANEVTLGEKQVRIFSVPVMQDEKLIGAAIVVEDITEEKLLEKTRDEFFSVTSHELRTPLTAIRGNAAMVQQYYADQIKDEDAKQMITDIHTASIRLIAIVNNFLDVSRLELNKITFTPEKFDMVPVVKGSMRELEQSAREKGLSWDLDMQDEGVYWVQADKSRGQQVLVNLLGNAVKYTKSGGVRVWVEQDRVVRVKVSDTGIGIAEDQVQFLFQKFRQVGAVGFTRNVSQSSGLGLYVTKLLVEQMGGRVYLEWSELGKGSTFTVELPKAA